MLQKFILLLFAILFAGNNTSAQIAAGDKTEQELYLDHLKNINSKNIPSNFLLNRAFIYEEQIESLYQFIEGYDDEEEKLVPPMSTIDGLSWINFYRSLVLSEVNRLKKLPSEESIISRLSNNPLSKTNVPILIFDVKGDLLEEQQIDTALKYSTIDTDINSIHLFGAMCYENTFYDRNITFSLQSENYFSGFNKKEDFIYIDFGNGNGIKKYSTAAGAITVNYSTIGEKIVKIYRDATLNGQPMQIGTSFVINIKNSTNISSATEIVVEDDVGSLGSKFLNTADTFINLNGIRATVFNGLGNNELDRPVIILQGFDPTGEISLKSQLEKYDGLKERLNDEGFDVIFAIINNTQLPLNTNATYLKNLLREINNRKVDNFENILIGESMGGLLSRIALKELENEGYDHEVGLYVSFDSPHQGANIPPGLQHLTKDLIESRSARITRLRIEIYDIITFGLANHIVGAFNGVDKKGSLNETLGVNKAFRTVSGLNSIAAKQMLVRHINPQGYYEANQKFMKELGYPENCRNIALINGSNFGRLQRTISNSPSLYNPGDRMFRLPIWRTDSSCNEFSLNAWSSPVNTTARVSQIKLKVGVLLPEVKIKWKSKCVIKIFKKCRLRTKVPVKVKVGLKCASTNLINKRRVHSFDNVSYDNAPGSTFPAANDLNILLNTAFVPTSSAIDLNETAYNNAVDPKGIRAITSPAVLRNFVNTDQTPFDAVYSGFFNTNHINLNRIPDLIDNVVDNEFMPANLFIQNRQLQFNRDFQAKEIIRIGRDVNTLENKTVKNGDVIIDNNAVFKVKAGKEIILSPGTFINEGVSANLTVDKKSGKKLLIDDSSNYFNIDFLGKSTYNIGENPVFKVITSDPDQNYSYYWSLKNTTANSTDSEFKIDENLSPGLHTFKIKVTSGSTVKEVTKVFEIKNTFNLNEDFNEKNLKTSEDNTIIYPNPVKNETTIISNHNIFKVIISSENGSIIDTFHNNNKTKWKTINLSNYTSGVYILQIYDSSNNFIIKKLVKK